MEDPVEVRESCGDHYEHLVYMPSVGLLVSSPDTFIHHSALHTAEKVHDFMSEQLNLAEAHFKIFGPVPLEVASTLSKIGPNVATMKPVIRPWFHILLLNAFDDSSSTASSLTWTEGRT